MEGTEGLRGCMWWCWPTYLLQAVPRFIGTVALCCKGGWQVPTSQRSQETPERTGVWQSVGSPGSVPRDLTHTCYFCSHSWPYAFAHDSELASWGPPQSPHLAMSLVLWPARMQQLSTLNSSNQPGIQGGRARSSACSESVLRLPICPACLMNSEGKLKQPALLVGWYTGWPLWASCTVLPTSHLSIN